MGRRVLARLLACSVLFQCAGEARPMLRSRHEPHLSPEQAFEFVCPTVASWHVFGAAFLQRLVKLFE